MFIPPQRYPYGCIFSALQFCREKVLGRHITRPLNFFAYHEKGLQCSRSFSSNRSVHHPFFLQYPRCRRCPKARDLLPARFHSLCRTNSCTSRPSTLPRCEHNSDAHHADSPFLHHSPIPTLYGNLERNTCATKESRATNTCPPHSHVLRNNHDPVLPE